MLSGGCPHPPVAPVPARDGQRQRKEKQRQCDNHPDDLRTIRHGTAVTKIAEEHSVPEGRPKSALAPIRRPSSRGGANAPERAKRPFLLDRARPVFFSTRGKRKWGVHPGWASPLAGARPSWPPSGGLHFPGRLITAPTHSRGSLTSGPPGSSAPTGAGNGFNPARRSAPADSPW